VISLQYFLKHELIADMGLRSACGLALLAAVITSLRGNDHPNIKKGQRLKG
jgi:hypothetical protein